MLSIVVNFFNNRREAQNTLFSLTRAYQIAAADLKFEVIVLDNGSSDPLSEPDVQKFGPEFKYHFIQTNSLSPAKAINAACRDAAGDELLVIIDGAHIVSPGIFTLTDSAFGLFDSAFIVTIPFHLGPKRQNISIQEGYTKQLEDRLLETSNWKKNGYALYRIAGDFSDGNLGWFGRPSESGCFAIRKADFLALGGFDERFESPGGGLVNLDFFLRAVSGPEMQYVMLLGEGTFHQLHGGVASNAPLANHPGAKFHDEYVRLRGIPFKRTIRRPFFIGAIPPEATQTAAFSAQHGLEAWRKLAETEKP
jgi:glycosyltransferase involved in cell wall biosynthesis